MRLEGRNQPVPPSGSSFETPRSARLLRMRSVELDALRKTTTLRVVAQLLLRLKALALIAFLVLCGNAHAAEEDKGVIANLISRALSSPSMSVSIGAVDGVLSSDASISDIVLSDRQGPWLKVDKVRLVWNRLALFSRRLEVDQLTIGRMELLRRPLPRRPRRRTPARSSRSCPNCRSRCSSSNSACRNSRSESRSSASRRVSTFPARRRSGRRPRALTSR